LRHAIGLTDQRGLPQIFSCHDEIVLEGDHRAEIKEVMETLPDWAVGLPVLAEVKCKPRYGK